MRGCPGCGAAPTPTAAACGGRSRPAPRRLDFTALPERAETRLAGLLLAIPDLIALGLPDMVTAAGYPSTPKIPALSYVLSLLALKLTSTRRVSHVYDIAADPGAALFAGLTALPKATALTTYSYRLEHSPAGGVPGRPGQGRARGRAGRRRGAEPGLPRRHALGRGPGAGKALRAPPLPAHPLGAHLLRRRRRHPHPPLRQRRPVQGQPEPRGHRVRRPLEGRHRPRPGPADLRLQAHHPGRPRRARRPPASASSPCAPATPASPRRWPPCPPAPGRP